MKIGILIFSHPEADSHAQADRFEKAGRELGIDIVRIHEPLLTIKNSDQKILIKCDGRPEMSILDFDSVICRPNFIEEPSLHQFTIQAFINSGVRVINGNISAAKNKLDQHIRLTEVGVPMPRWAIAHTPENLLATAKSIGFPVVCKVAFGTHGKGVFFAPTQETFLPIVDYLAVRDGNPVIIEEYIETDRRDLRVFVLNGRILAAMERVAKPGDIRANTSIGGTGTHVELSPDETALAIRAAHTFNLEICGVDILRSPRGPLVIEVNANPGFKELERVTGIDIAKAILTSVIHQ